MGMDPERAQLDAHRAGLPRACGDGPLLPVSIARGAQATPRLWGWTCDCGYVVGTMKGYPAPVGMDLYYDYYL